MNDDSGSRPAERAEHAISPARTWAVLIFMVVDEDALVPYALIDLRQIQKIGHATGCDVLVHVCWPNTPPERFDVRDGDLNPVPVPSASSGQTRAEALRAFLLDALREYPAAHYALLLWGHAYGFGFGRPDAGRITFPELASILDDCARHRDGTKLEILACNACRIGKIETVYELREVVRYLVASQVGVPYRGWPLREVLADVVSRPSIAPAELAKAMVTRFCDSYRQQTVTMTMLDLQQSTEPLMRLRTLAETLFTEIEQSDEELQCAHDAFVRAANEEEETEPVVDLHELCVHLAELSHSAAVKAAAADLLLALRAPAFVASHDGTGPGSPRLHGVGLYVPHVGLDTRSSLFSQLGLEHARMWTEVVRRLRSAGKHQHILHAMSALEAETLRNAAPSPPAAGESSE